MTPKPLWEWLVKLSIAMFVKLTGPVRITEEAGVFEHTRTERMTTGTMSLTDPDADSSEVAERVDTAFLSSPQTILREIPDENPIDWPNSEPQDTWGGDDLPWEVEISGSSAKRLYEYACEVADDDYDPQESEDIGYRKSPFHVLSRWADSGRYKTSSHGGPGRTLEHLVEHITFEHGGFDALHEAPDWDDEIIMTQYERP